MFIEDFFHISGHTRPGAWQRLSVLAGLMLVGVFFTGNCLAQTNTPAQVAFGVVQRFIGPRASEIVFQSIPQTNNCDVYAYSATNGILTVSGSSTVAMCRGFYDYFKANGMGICSWATNRVALPVQWPDAPVTRVATPFRHHYYFNVCTYGYTMPYWDWPRWARELDWMALHGVDMPLALVGTEAIGTRVWKQLGLTQTEIDPFYSGPAHLPWQRMGNLTGWDGPLSDAWNTDQIALQHQILDRMHSLGMTPIAPAFAGFVPAAITSHYANLALTTMSWNGFSSKLLLPTNTANTMLFTNIGALYIKTWEQEFGTNQFFTADTLNELAVPGTNVLSQLSTNLYRSLVVGDSNAVWVIDGWMFGYQRSSWTTNNVQALLSAPPNDHMLIIDLACNFNALVWGKGYDFNLYSGFYGKQWVYSTTPGFGGNVMFSEKLDYFATGVTNALASTSRGNLFAYGFAPEGTENNEVIYELCSDVGWSGQPVTLTNWLSAYGQTRYGGYPPAMATAWSNLLASCYGGTIEHPYFAWQKQPSLSPSSSENTSAAFIAAAQQFLNASTNLGNVEPYRSDAVEIAALALGIQADALLQAACAAWQQGNTNACNSNAAAALNKLYTADRLLESHPNHRLQRWVDFARASGTTPAERDHYEANSKRINTIWGGSINDYAARVWSGLMRDYYIPRWRAFFDSLNAGQTGNFKTWGNQWITRPGVSQASPFVDPIATAIQALATNMAIGPYFTFEPQNVTVNAGGTLTLTAGIGGDTNLNCQWFSVSSDGLTTNVLTAGTNAVLILSNVMTNAAGTYYLVVSNPVGTATSYGAVVQVTPPTPPLLTQNLTPTSATLYQGRSITFSVRLSPLSSPPLTYLWKSNGVTIAVTTNVSSLTLTGLPWSATNGVYSVTITNLSGSTSSGSAVLSLVPAPTSAYANVILADNPVAWWRLGESGGTVARDYCGGHDGTVFGGLTFGQAGCLTNDSNTSAYCNGTTGYIEVPWSADLNPAQYTIECWAKVMGGSGNYRSPLCSRDTGSDPDAGYMFYAQSGNNWGFWTGAGGTWNKLSGPTVGQNQWVHLAATSDTTTGNMVFYVNGTQVASVTNVTYQNLATPLRIGASATEGTPQFFL